MTSSSSSTPMASFWHDDFAPLQFAGKRILAALRRDESAPDADLYRRISSTSNSNTGGNIANASDASSHCYVAPSSTADGGAPTTPTKARGASIPSSSSSSPTSAKMKHERSIPLPQVLAQEMQSVQHSMYMGLFTEAGLAWITIDAKLYLWNISRGAMDGSTQEFLSFTVPTNRPIISVGLVPPKQGVFKGIVEWCLIVTTSEQAFLCALARPAVAADADVNMGGALLTYAPLKLVPTRFIIPSDWINYLSVAGNKQGRIFLGGQDGNVYEMDYDGVAAASHIQKQQHRALQTQLDRFYDEDGPCPEVIIDQDGSNWTLASHVVQTGRDAVRSVLAKATQNMRPNKCRKYNVSNPNSIFSAIVPDAMQSFGRSILGIGNGSTTGGGPIVQMVVDEERNVLYTLSSRGWICALDIYNDPSASAAGASNGNTATQNGGFSLGASAVPPQAKVAAVLDAPKTARLYLEAVSRGRVYPPSSSAFSSAKSEGIISFPGGGMAAQAGVGGMDGARAVLKLADASASANNSGRNRTRANKPKDNSVLMPVSIHVVPRRESAHLTLVAVTAGGLRYYLSTLTPQVVTSGLSARKPTSFSSSQHRPKDDPTAPHSKFSFCHVRSPPPLASLNITNAANGVQTTPRGGGGNFGWSSMSSIDGGGTPNFMDSHLLNPRMTSGLDKMPRVDASWYRLGVFVVALKTMKSSSASSVTGSVPEDSRTILGNLIVTSCTDSVARIPVNSTPNNGANDDSMSPDRSPNNQLALTNRGFGKYVAPGGICEVISLPMSEAYGSASSRDHLDQLLPGGRVWDIGSSPSNESSLLQLALRSKTPSDSELSIGLVPPYFARIRGSLPIPQNNATRFQEGSRGQQLVALTPDGQTVASTAMQLVSNLFLSRPLSYGMPGRRSARNGKAQAQQPNAVQELYRISKRAGWEGFSLSAGEVKSSSRLPSRASARRALTEGSTNKSKSARLSPWLLRPATVPLNPLALQHILLPNEMVALNVGGLHYFQIESILTGLVDTLLAAGVNAADDSSVSNFFTSYGYKEGCAMCLLLAIGCGPPGMGTNEELKGRAARAALARAFVPKLQLVSAETGTPATGSTTSANESTIPPGYEFKASALCEGLGLVISRLLRPIWNKPTVVVTEGRIIRRTLSKKTRISPAKVELLLDDQTLDEIRRPLMALRKLMRDVFARAIEAVPGAPVRDSMDIDENAMPGQEHFLTRAIEHQMQSRSGSGGFQQLQMSEAEEIARTMEERTIHCYYRLVSRTVQLLSLLSHLRRAQALQEVPEVEWGLLHGILFSQLVETSDGQERLENVLNSLITPTNIAGSGSGNGNARAPTLAPSAYASQLAEQFSTECYHFFSLGSRFSYLGFRCASDALSYPPQSTRRAVCAKEAINHFMQAARHWFSAPLITGRILHSKERESNREISENALRFDSPLANAMALLVELGEVAAAVQICMRTASNFSQGRLRLTDSTDLAVREQVIQDVLPWERGLYHKKPDDDDAGSPSNTSTALALGITVTSKDALKTCFALIFHQLAELLDAPDKTLGENMVSACAAVNDKEFLHSFFAHLVEINQKETLLRIDSPDLENWLKEYCATSEKDLLWKYHVIQGRYFQAGEQAWKIATSPKDDVHLMDRIDYLVRASDAFGKVMQTVEQPYSSMQWNAIGSSPAQPSREEVARNETSVRETLAITRLQSRVLHQVQNSKYEIPPDDVKALSFSLVPVSDLYNKYASPMDMYDICLLVLHTCRHDEREAIEALWKSVLCDEILPCNTRSNALFAFLRDFVEGSHIDSPAMQLLDNESAPTNFSTPLFEDGTWVKKIEGRVISLGKELYGTGADYVFPADFLIRCLERLHRLISGISSSIVTPEWPFSVLIRAGVPYLVTLDGYDRIIESEDHAVMGGVVNDKRLNHLTSILCMLETWMREASQGAYGAQNPAANQLSDAKATGALSRRLESYRAQARSIPEARDLETRFDEIEQFIERV